MNILRAKPAVLLLIVFLLFLNPYISYAEAEIHDKILSDATEDIKLSGTDFDFYEKAQAITKGEQAIETEGIFNKLLNIFLKFFKENISLLIRLGALCVFSGIISAISEPDGSQVSYLALLSLVFSIAFDVLKNILIICQTTIDNLLIFMQSLLPSVLMLSQSDAHAFVISFSPALFTCIQAIVYISKECFLPMIMFSAVLSAINSMTTHFHITKLLETCNLFIKWALGLLMTVYVALLTICGFSGAIQSGAVSKTVKYAIASFIPMVGGVLSESAESVLLSMSTIKNTIGLTGILAVVSLSVSPLLNVLSVSVIFRLIASITEPASDKRIIKLVSGFSSSVSLVFAILLAVCAMFIISIAMLLSLSNFPQMMR